MTKSEKQHPTLLPIVRAVSDLRGEIIKWRNEGRTIGLVPTMGALHDGHISLLQEARRRADKVVTTIFVNPTQFGPNEDFTKYPRDEAADVEKLIAAKCDLLYAPTVTEMYPPNFSTTVRVGDVTEGLCGAARPGHFDGVAAVVTKLLMQALPDVAVFGEKDYQQFVMIKRFVRDLDIPVEVVGAPTVREHDGLAMSSRNVYLSEDERARAKQFPWVLNTLAIDISLRPNDVAQAIEKARKLLADVGIDRVEYLEVRDAATLEPMEAFDRPARLLGAIQIGKTRLIDNVPIPEAE
ncbi:MAG TPA: pantoate--beta-alanine ligase [Alphaproteobacteria bacterium]|nr:pantoate--beta-alanine ligase [Alphaproteobacteria bacterium]